MEDINDGWLDLIDRISPAANLKLSLYITLI